MFNLICTKCKNKVKKNFEFCPFCGNKMSSSSDKEDYGLIGKNDFLDEQIMPQMKDSFVEKLFNQTMKMLENQMKNLSDESRENNQNKIPNIGPGPNHSLNVQFFINGKKVTNENEEKKEQNKRIEMNKMPLEKLERFSKLPKIEPESKVRRIGNKVVYELIVPGVKNIEDILINRLESSIEIKALSKDISYNKIINVNLPILRYGLDNDNLIIELGAK